MSMLCGGKEVEQQHVCCQVSSCSLSHTASKRTAQYCCLILSAPAQFSDLYYRGYRTAQKLGRSLVSLVPLSHGNELQVNEVHFTSKGCFLQFHACALGQCSSNLSHHFIPLIPTFFCSVGFCVFSQWKCRSLQCEFSSTDYRFVYIRSSLH